MAFVCAVDRTLDCIQKFLSVHDIIAVMDSIGVPRGQGGLSLSPAHCQVRGFQSRCDVWFSLSQCGTLVLAGSAYQLFQDQGTWCGDLLAGPLWPNGMQ